MQPRANRVLPILYLPFLLLGSGAKYAHTFFFDIEDENKREEYFNKTNERGKEILHGAERGVESMGFYVDGLHSYPHGEGDLPYRIKLVSIRAIREVRISLRAKYHVNGEEVRPSTPKNNYRNEIVYRGTWSPKGAGESFFLEGTWKIVRAWEPRCEIVFYLELYNKDALKLETGPGSGLHPDYDVDYKITFRKTQKEMIYGNRLPWRRNLNFALPNDPFVPNWGSAMLYGSRRRFGSNYTEYEIHGRNFKTEYTDPSFGILPLHESYFKVKDYLGDWTGLDWKSGRLRIYGYPNDFKVGKKVYDPKRREYCREFSILPEQRAEGTYMKFEKPFYVSEDGRSLVAAPFLGGSGLRYFKTEHLFLPLNPTSESREYLCRIELDDFGEQNCDKFVHEFTVLRTKNLLSSIVDGGYHLVEVY